jgi:plasmid stabilization system protein ParE
MTWSVQFAPEALAQLVALEKRIAEAGAPIAAARYIDAIVDCCMKLQTFPESEMHIEKMPIQFDIMLIITLSGT